MLKEKLHIERKEVARLEVDFSGSIQGYAMAWLKLTNIAREYKNIIYKIKNSIDDTVCVYCDINREQEMKDMLNGFYSYMDENNKLIDIGKVTTATHEIIVIPHYEAWSTCKLDDPKWDEDMQAMPYDFGNVVEDY